MNLPRHLVMIPDGNRRWAKAQGKPATWGHLQGAKQVKEILKTALDLKIPYFTFWGASVTNITERSRLEVNFLFKLFQSYFKKLLKSKALQENEIRVRVLGRWQEFCPEKLKNIIHEMIDKTKHHDKFHLTFLLAYSGTDEMKAAIKKIV